MRPIDSEAAYQFLTDQLVKETGAFSKGVNKGLNIARSALRNEQIAPTLTPQFPSSGVANPEIISAAKRAAGAWRGTDAYRQAAEIIDMLVAKLENMHTPKNEQLTCEGCYWETHGSFGKCIDCIRGKDKDNYRRPPERQEDTHA